MKKFLGIFLVILIVGIVGVFMVVNFFTTEKVAMTVEDFRDIMEEKGFVLYDVTYQFAEHSDQVKKVYVAKKSDYQIEFYELSSDEDAIQIYNINRNNFETESSNSSIATYKNIANYATYALTSNGSYKYISRIDNTMIYSNVEETYKDTIKTLMKEIGY